MAKDLQLHSTAGVIKISSVHNDEQSLVIQFTTGACALVNLQQLDDTKMFKFPCHDVVDVSCRKLAVRRECHLSHASTYSPTFPSQHHGDLQFTVTSGGMQITECFTTPAVIHAQTATDEITRLVSLSVKDVWSRFGQLAASVTSTP